MAGVEESVTGARDLADGAKITERCLWSACKAISVGVLLIGCGAAMATLGFYSDHLSTVEEQRGNSTVLIKNENRDWQLDSLTYLGPMVMGLGGFIIVATCVMTFEARESRVAKLGWFKRTARASFVATDPVSGGDVLVTSAASLGAERSVIRQKPAAALVGGPPIACVPHDPSLERARRAVQDTVQPADPTGDVPWDRRDIVMGAAVACASAVTNPVSAGYNSPSINTDQSSVSAAAAAAIACSSRARRLSSFGDIAPLRKCPSEPNLAQRQMHHCQHLYQLELWQQLQPQQPQSPLYISGLSNAATAHKQQQPQQQDAKVGLADVRTVAATCSDPSVIVEASGSSSQSAASPWGETMTFSYTEILKGTELIENTNIFQQQDNSQMESRPTAAIGAGLLRPPRLGQGARCSADLRQVLSFDCGTAPSVALDGEVAPLTAGGQDTAFGDVTSQRRLSGHSEPAPFVDETPTADCRLVTAGVPRRHHHRHHHHRRRCSGHERQEGAPSPARPQSLTARGDGVSQKPLQRVEGSSCKARPDSSASDNSSPSATPPTGHPETTALGDSQADWQPSAIGFQSSGYEFSVASGAINKPVAHSGLLVDSDGGEAQSDGRRSDVEAANVHSDRHLRVEHDCSGD